MSFSKSVAEIHQEVIDGRRYILIPAGRRRISAAQHFYQISKKQIGAVKYGRPRFVHIRFSRRGYYPCKICFDWRNFIYESNRDRAPDR